ncbi:MmyB family transcriptional regulator [Siccirubricoccus phaeus]|uniref:MmyB family transcriptional regulator n=1 Tax=Siccirubricoccus phaeus TaxID=2595053 RepID=UPI0011F0EAFA|nr:helix-turn-helix domain-containing protein [Siccirubricoccus phaeus]
MQGTGESVGELLRQWRQRRRLSQMALALEAEISTRHLSCLETGKAAPSREMVLRLAEPLELPLRERNRLLLAAGFAPLFPQRGLDHPALAPALAAIRQVLAAQMPNPALAVDRHWQLVAANPMAGRLMAGAAPALLAPPVNVLRLSLHPEGLAPRIRNLAEWRAHLLARLRRQVELSADPALAALLEELRRLPAPREKPPEVAAEAIAVPLRLAVPGGAVLELLSTTTVFGTPVDVTLSELAVEAFLPADAVTAAALQQFYIS